MDAETVNKLLEINRRFYSRFGAAFSASRSSARLNLEPFRNYLTDGMRLLDAGCGNGRLARALERAGYALDYLGIDNSAELIALAEQKSDVLKRVRAHFRVVDLTALHWSENLRDAAPFDIIVALAVLHHIPSFELRANVLRESNKLLKPRGIFVMCNWHFLNDGRLRKKIVLWENRRDVPLERLEHGDYLVDWKRGGVGYRYVHLVDKKEVEQLAHASGFQIVEQFYADNDLNLYSILQPTRS